MRAEGASLPGHRCPGRCCSGVVKDASLSGPSRRSSFFVFANSNLSKSAMLFWQCLTMLFLPYEVIMSAGSDAARQREHHPAGHAGGVRGLARQHVLRHVAEGEGECRGRGNRRRGGTCRFVIVTGGDHRLFMCCTLTWHVTVSPE